MRSIILSTGIFFTACQSEAYMDSSEKTIHLVSDQFTEEFCVTGKDPGSVKDVSYHWFTGKVLNVSTAGYSGKLLHGSYTSYFLNGALHIKGNFNKGMKEGQWITWNSSGRLAERAMWKRGVLHGRCELFDHGGKSLAILTYRHGRLDGKCIWFNGELTDTCFYSDGTEVPEKRTWSLWKN